jgi:geranylgeranyl pyrophosphate synthase
MSIAAVRELAGPGLPQYMREVEDVLREAVSHVPGRAAEAGAETLESGGKRLRPALVYLCAPGPAQERPELAAAGAAVELVHMATLVHDDLLDASPLRRGRRTVWKAHGRPVAVAAGDYLFARAFAVVAGTGSARATAALSEACLALARGEALQREQAGSLDVTVEQYLERCRLKTGRLFAAASTIGGILAGLADDAIAALDEFAVALGLAFQIADDILDCDGRPDTTGKPLGTDLLDGTITLPLIVAARRDETVAATIRRGASPADVLPTLAAVARSGAVAEARRFAERHAHEANAALGRLTGVLDVGPLRAIVATAVDRDA